jgi:hypothetical protein
VIDQQKTELIYGFKTGGYYMCEGCYLSIPNTGMYVYNHVFKVPVKVLGLKFRTDSTHLFDSVDLILNPDTPIGYIDMATSKGSSTVVTSPSVVQYMQVGFNLSTPNEDLGTVTSIDTMSNTVTMSKQCTFDYTQYTPLFMNQYIVKDYSISSSGEHLIGYGTIDKFLTANSTIRLVYKNINAFQKSFAFNFEYEY